MKLKKRPVLPDGKRKPVMAGNWKMNKNTVEAVKLTQEIAFKADDRWGSLVEVILCPPAIDIKSVWNVIEFENNLEIEVGAQNVHWEESGAYTGEISPLMLKEFCTHCIVGHSERRGYFGETDETVNMKVKALIAHEIHPIMCCGEGLEVRDAGTTLEFVEQQVRKGLEGVSGEDLKETIIAYEPIWAIGTGRAATPEQAQEVCAHIRGVVAEMAGNEVADTMRILYGGSMNVGNVEKLMPMPDIDGGLIGGAALKANDFAELVKAAYTVGI